MSAPTPQYGDTPPEPPLAPVVAEVQTAVQQAAVVNVDETGWRQGKQQAWLWTTVTPTLTVFLIDRTRGSAALTALWGMSSPALSDPTAGRRTAGF